MTETGRPALEFSFRPVPTAPGEEEIVSVFPRQGVLVVILGGMLMAFCVPYFAVGLELPDGVDGGVGWFFFAFTAFWLVGWSVGVAALAAGFLASLFAAERVTLGPGVLRVRLEVFGVGAAVRLGAEQVADLRVVGPGEDAKGDVRGRHLAFDAGFGRPMRIGVGLTAAEAEQLHARIRAALARRVGPPHSPSVPARAAELASAPVRAPSSERAVSASLLALLAANLVPLLGVLFLDWQVAEVMLVFWAESGVVGLWNLAKFWVIGRWLALPLGVFFLGHFGGFMAAHGFFLYSLFLEDGANGRGFAEVMAGYAYLLPAVLALFVSHGISFFQNFLGRREFEGRTLGEQMGAPYGRIVVMHLTILFGAFLTLFLGDALGPLVLLVVLKIVADVRAHRRAHARRVRAA